MGADKIGSKIFSSPWKESKCVGAIMCSHSQYLLSIFVFTLCSIAFFTRGASTWLSKPRNVRYIMLPQALWGRNEIKLSHIIKIWNYSYTERPLWLGSRMIGVLTALLEHAQNGYGLIDNWWVFDRIVWHMIGDLSQKGYWIFVASLILRRRQNESICMLLNNS